MHIHTFLDLDLVQRVTTNPADCDQCRHAANSLVSVRHCHCRPCVLQREAVERAIAAEEAEDGPIADYSCHCGSGPCRRHGTSPDTSDHYPTTEDADGF